MVFLSLIIDSKGPTIQQENIDRLLILALFSFCIEIYASEKRQLLNFGVDAKEAWMDYENPENFLPYHSHAPLQTKLAALPTKGSSTKVPWRSNYWPDTRGNIAYRWNLDEPQNGFEYPLYSKKEIKKCVQKT